MVQDVEKRNKSYNQYVENVTKKAGVYTTALRHL